MRIPTLLSALTVALLLSGCANMSDSGRRTLQGGAIGAAGGAVVGAFSGNAGKGALIGTGAGLVGGYLYDQHKKSEEDAYRRGYQDAKTKR